MKRFLESFVGSPTGPPVPAPVAVAASDDGRLSPAAVASDPLGFLAAVASSSSTVAAVVQARRDDPRKTPSHDEMEENDEEFFDAQEVPETTETPVELSGDAWERTGPMIRPSLALSGVALEGFIRKQRYQLQRSVKGIPFGYDVYRLVEAAHEFGFTDLIRWTTLTDDQDAVFIPHKHVFCRTVLMNCPDCHYTNFEGFRKALVEYGFVLRHHRRSDENGSATLIHRSLRRGKPDMARTILHKSSVTKSPPPPLRSTRLDGEELHAFVRKQDYQLQNSQKKGHPFGPELHRLITDAHVHGFDRYCGWTEVQPPPDTQGVDALAIPDRDAFLQHVLRRCPSCSYQTFDSFRSALYQYGFSSLGRRHVGDELVMAHADFVRGDPERARRIVNKFAGRRSTESAKRKRVPTDHDTPTEGSRSPSATTSAAAAATTTTDESWAMSPPVHHHVADDPVSARRRRLTGPDLSSFLRTRDYQLKNSTLVGVPFGYDLYRLAEDAHAHGFEDLVRWTKVARRGGNGNGGGDHSQKQDAIWIPNRQTFVSDVLAHCPCCSYKIFDSFQTTLSSFGFRTTTVRSGKDGGIGAVIVHDHLRRGDPDAARKGIVNRYTNKKRERGLGSDISLDNYVGSPRRRRTSTDRFVVPQPRSEAGHAAGPTHPADGATTTTQSASVPFVSAPFKPSPFQRPPDQRPRLHVDRTRLIQTIHESENLSALLQRQRHPDIHGCCACHGRDDEADLFRCGFCRRTQHGRCLVERYAMTPDPAGGDRHPICQDCIDLAVDFVARNRVVAKSVCKDVIQDLPFALRLPAAEHRYDFSNPSIMGAELHRLLDDAATRGFEFIVAWRQGGDSFEVYHRPLFIEWILGKDYKGIESFNSFNARLKSHGFVRVYNTGDSVVDDRGFIHPHFHRAKPNEASKVIKMNAMTLEQKREYKEWKKSQLSWERPQAATKIPDIKTIMDRIENDSRKTLRRYTGEVWDDDCALCGDGGDLLLCECCNQVNHLKCVQRLFTVSKPGKNDDFLCHDCLQKAVHEGLAGPKSMTESLATSKPCSLSSPIPKASPTKSHHVLPLWDIPLIMRRIDNDLKRNGKSKKKYSLSRYMGEVWEDKCAVCGFGGDLFVCECCPKANHLLCLQQLYNVKEPGPDDDFLCRDCLQKASHERIGGSSIIPGLAPKKDLQHSVVNNPMVSSKRAVPPASTIAPHLEYCLRDLKHGFGAHLYNLIQDGKFSAYISWSDDGKSFIIYDREDFLANVARNFASPECRWSSFSATLCHQGFHRILGTNRIEYSHPLFLRGRPDLAEKVKSSKCKDSSTGHNGNDRFSPAAGLKRPPPSTYDLRGKRYGFGIQLYNLVEDGHYPEHISWSHNGKSAIIHDRGAFIAKVAKTYTQWQDFTNALSRQGFRLVQQGRKSEITHPLFVQGMPRLAERIESFRGVSKEKKDQILLQMTSKKYQEKLLQGMPIAELAHSIENAPRSNPNDLARDEDKSFADNVEESMGDPSEQLDPREAIKSLTPGHCLDFDEKFPLRLYDLLSLASSHNEEFNGTGLAKIVSWNEPSGCSFHIHDIKLMKVLLRHCSRNASASGEALYNSFLETLSLFEFTYSKDTNENGWSNDLFQRDMREAAEWIQPLGEPLHPSAPVFSPASDAEESDASMDLDGLLDSSLTFPERLHYVLTHSSEFGFSHILAWQPGGKHFEIFDREQFRQKVLPYIQKSPKWLNFTSTLGRYCIRRTKVRTQTDVYGHDMFVRGNPELASKIQYVRADRP